MYETLKNIRKSWDDGINHLPTGDSDFATPTVCSEMNSSCSNMVSVVENIGDIKRENEDLSSYG